ncbi:HAMP domain-containing sensor histidine kinase [Streptomyces sp. H23]|uniref:sensor histidine kinase n=1 Tax=Streptomyces sp. H23 TaxID=2541723 RepID=UPI00106EA38C|nr:HAMP domain-containing sensor histidine kinase [Streptomyces sp. H23]
MRWPRLRTLRARLTAGLLVLLAVACATVGGAAVLELNGFLTDRLDQQLADTGSAFAASLEHPATDHDDHDGDERGDTRRQAAETLGVRIADGRVTNAAVVRQGDAPADVVTLEVDAEDARALAAVPTDGQGHSVELTGLGDYRVRAWQGRDGDTLITGLPLEPVEAAVHRLELVAGGVFGLALVGAGVAGALWVRWSLRSLSRIADTATRVSELPLASGTVALPARAPDTRPRSEEVDQVTTAFNRMLGHVEHALTQRQRSEERLRSFSADASHELRTPVASVRGHAELALLHPGPLPSEVGRALERIAAESARMGAMVDDLLLLARLDAGRPLEDEPVDLTRLVLDVVDDARAAGPDHRWSLELPQEPVIVSGDRHRLHQLLANLTANARLHTPPGTAVTVGVRRDDDGTACLTVTDDGPGVPPALRDHLFDRFVHGDGPRGADGGGTGLGLSIVAAVAAAHGGTATVTGEPGTTTFTVRLPRRPPG